MLAHDQREKNKEYVGFGLFLKRKKKYKREKVKGGNELGMTEEYQDEGSQIRDLIKTRKP